MIQFAKMIGAQSFWRVILPCVRVCDEILTKRDSTVRAFSQVRALVYL